MAVPSGGARLLKRVDLDRVVGGFVLLLRPCRVLVLSPEPSLSEVTRYLLTAVPLGSPGSIAGVSGSCPLGSHSSGSSLLD